MSNLSAAHFHNEEAAYAYVEERLWPHGAVCPHCGGVDRVGKLKGKTTRAGLWKCYQCRKPFTVKIGTIFEDSKVPMNVWLQAMYLIAGSKKGMSSNQLHRILGVTLKTAWFMSHRIREAMQETETWPMGGLGATVEADETFIGREPGSSVQRGAWHKMKVLALVERGGRSRAMVVDHIGIPQIRSFLTENVHRLTKLNTDEAGVYTKVGRYFYQHHVVNHRSGEYVRDKAHTNTIEGYFSIFKRGMKGVYQHCAKQHLHRYVAEFNFRYSNRVALGIGDTERSDLLLRGVIGKRLTYQTASARA
ncbi:MAG: IS1595 family transposase [Croceibacterium sp.]